MAEKKETKTNKRRTRVKDLPKEEKELGGEELKNIKGGGSGGGSDSHSGVANLFTKI